jgi:hypothetical protein
MPVSLFVLLITLSIETQLSDIPWTPGSNLTEAMADQGIGVEFAAGILASEAG